MLIKVHNLTKSYGDTVALRALNFSIKEGTVCGIIGPNGSGKTTFLSILTGLLNATNGGITIESNKTMGALIEGPSFYNHLTVRQNLQLIGHLRNVANPDTSVVLDLVNLSEQADKKYERLSLGMKQRLGIAGTLVGNSDIIVLDEPTNGVDSLGITEIREIIIQLQNINKTVIIASHLLTEIEQICSDLIILHNGNLVFDGSPRELMKTQKSMIEVAAKDNGKLLAIFKDYAGIIAIHHKSGMLLLEVSDYISTNDINMLCTSNGIILSSLSVAEPKLENAFLNLIKSSKNE